MSNIHKLNTYIPNPKLKRPRKPKEFNFIEYVWGVYSEIAKTKSILVDQSVDAVRELHPPPPNQKREIIIYPFRVHLSDTILLKQFMSAEISDKPWLIGPPPYQGVEM